MINLEKNYPQNPITHLPKLELGQKVTIKSLDWYNSNKDTDTGVIKLTTEVFVEEMSEYCGKTAIIIDVFKDGDSMVDDNIMFRIVLVNYLQNLLLVICLNIVVKLQQS